MTSAENGTGRSPLRGLLTRDVRVVAAGASVLAVIESDRSGGNTSALQTATLGEWQLRTEQAISGVRSLTIQLSGN